MTFGMKLQKLRQESGLSQEKLAEQLNVSRQAISKWELGTAAPDTDNIVRLHKFFQVPLEYLMLEDCDDPNPSLGQPEPPQPPPLSPAAGSGRWRKYGWLWLLAAGCLMECLSYLLCYVVQTREFQVYGSCSTDLTDYLFQPPLQLLTGLGILLIFAGLAFRILQLARGKQT